MKNIVIDLDGTLTEDIDVEYSDKPVRVEVVKRLKEYKAMGFNIIISTSRGMRTYNGDIGKINAKVLPDIVAWLNKHNIPYDSIMVGKAWCGFDGFYIDDKAIRPSEFVQKSYTEIQDMLSQEVAYKQIICDKSKNS
ncbi:HAD family hydrolase [Helicobacter bilis]|uniref:capsular biosynthesis protein n=1 Tax=Helicobacter bilis TaxID=37372 RepID=UPI000CF0E107|nr:capsular biosynthesis protein [Helicobacter bilis]